MSIKISLPAIALLLASAACSPSERSKAERKADSAAGAIASGAREAGEKAESAAGSVATEVRAALSVINVSTGHHVDGERRTLDNTDDFAPSDTIYASVHTSGTANNGAVTGRWTFQDKVLHEQTDTVTTKGDARSVFYIVKPGGLPKGKYTLHVIIDGREVRTKDVSVR